MIAAPMELGTQLERDITAELAGGADPTDAQFRLLVESVSDYAIYLLDTAGRVVSWNTGAERIKGYAAAGILGRHFSIFYLPEDRAAGRPDQMLAQTARPGGLPRPAGGIVRRERRRSAFKEEHDRARAGARHPRRRAHPHGRQVSGVRRGGRRRWHRRHRHRYHGAQALRAGAARA